MQRIAIYDMDKTITRDATWPLFLLHAARGRRAWRRALLPVAGVATGLWALRLLSRARLKTVSHRMVIGPRLSQAEAERLAGSFAEQMLAHQVLPAARAQIRADRASGHLLVLATASYAFYAGAIGRALGFDAVIGTGCGTDAQGALLSAIQGENCYGAAKLRMVEAWFAAQGIDRTRAHVRFYSDHRSDAPVFEWADEAFAVNAHAPLQRLAIERRWTMLDWRRETLG